MSIEKENNFNNLEFQDPLNNPNISIKEYFSSIIKTKSVEELISYDNKLFSEIRNLESEKHILVTQNYKKFVAATETINTIKSSLVGFEKDLFSLQSKIGNMVQNFNTVNTSIEAKLKQTQEIYKVKKDLKRLNFINDLPSVLENQLILYLNSEPKDIKLLEKSLNYYEKCKQFLHLYKDNSLVKSIYEKTNELIFRYRHLIQDELHITDFNEFKLEHFDTCLSLLVKIEEDKSELILTFLDRYKFLINKKFDEVFGMRDGVSEINFTTYSKIYDNFEFAINENEFLFYEHQIAYELTSTSEKNYENQNHINMLGLNVNIKNLSSKFFKKGCFIWVCKKIQEQVISQFIELAYVYFTKIFDGGNSFHLNSLFEYIISLFNKKIKDLLESEKSRNEVIIDPVFFKEGLINFYFSFCEALQKVNDEKIESNKFEEKILQNNKLLTEIYINNLLENHVQRILEIFRTSSYYGTFKISQKSVVSGGSQHFNNNLKSNFFSHSQFEKLFTENSSLFNKLITIFIEDTAQIKKLDLAELYNTSLDEANKVNLKIISSFISIFFFILKSSNLLKFDNSKNLSQNISFTTKEGLQRIISQIKEFFPSYTKERIYFKIILCKIMCNSNFSGLKNMIDKVLREFPQIKSNKSQYNELKSYLEKDLIETLGYLYDSIVQINDVQVNKKLKELFLGVEWSNYDMAITFRKDVRDFCHGLYYLKTELYDLLEEEKKYFEENVSSAINQAIWNKKQKKNTKYQNEMEVLNIRRLSIYTTNANSPQMIVYTISKIFFKAINEYVKLKKFSKEGFQQIQLDMNLIKYFFKENLIIDVDNILDGFFLEILKNAKFNTLNSESFDESLISGLLDEHKKEFKEIVKNMSNPQENNN